MATEPIQSPTQSRRRGNVAERMKSAGMAAEQLGFEVRRVVLNESAAGWCRVGERKLLFIDVAASTAEQLQQIEDALASYRSASAA